MLCLLLPLLLLPLLPAAPTVTVLHLPCVICIHLELRQLRD
jgi:hypothetical protein